MGLTKDYWRGYREGKSAVLILGIEAAEKMREWNGLKLDRARGYVQGIDEMRNELKKLIQLEKKYREGSEYGK